MCLWGRRPRLGLDRRDEAIAASGQGLDVTGDLGGVSQRVPQLLDCVVESRVEIDEGSRWPQPLPQLLPRHELARAVQQQRKDPERLLGKPDLATALAELA